MKINWLRIVGSLAWILFVTTVTIGTVTIMANFSIEAHPAWYMLDGFNRESYSGLAMLYMITTTLTGGVVLVTSVWHIFSHKWDFWKWLARTFPVPEKIEDDLCEPSPSNWR